MTTNIKYILLKLLIVFFISSSSFAQRINIGSKAPNFELMDQESNYFNSKDYLGKKAIVIFFYIEDEHPICTREVIAFNNKLKEFEELDAVVVGINPNSLIYHRKFVIKLNINYPILFDRNNETQKKFKVPNFKKTKNPQRYTFVIDKNGVIQKIFHNDTNAEIHVIEALKTLENL